MRNLSLIITVLFPLSFSAFAECTKSPAFDSDVAQILDARGMSLREKAEAVEKAQRELQASFGEKEADYRKRGLVKLPELIQARQKLEAEIEKLPKPTAIEEVRAALKASKEKFTDLTMQSVRHLAQTVCVRTDYSVSQRAIVCERLRATAGIPAASNRIGYVVMHTPSAQPFTDLDEALQAVKMIAESYWPAGNDFSSVAAAQAQVKRQEAELAALETKEKARSEKALTLNSELVQTSKEIAAIQAQREELKNLLLRNRQLIAEKAQIDIEMTKGLDGLKITILELTKEIDCGDVRTERGLAKESAARSDSREPAADASAVVDSK
jgi:hypothetical protein